MTRRGRDPDAEQEAADEVTDVPEETIEPAPQHTPVTHRTKNLREQESAFAMNVTRPGAILI